MIFGFVNSDLQDQLKRLLDATPIGYSTPTLDTIEVTGHYEEAFDSLVDVVREMRFPFWHSFRALDPAKYADYIAYMKSNGIDYEEEIHGDHSEERWILTDTENQRYGWGVEEVSAP